MRGGQQARVAGAGHDPVEDRGEHARSHARQLPPGQEDEKASRRDHQQRDHVDRRHLVRAERAERGCVDPQDPRRLVVHPAFRVERRPAVHERCNRCIDRFVAVEEPMEERGHVRQEDRRRGDPAHHQRIWRAACHRRCRHGAHLYCCTVGR